VADHRQRGRHGAGEPLAAGPAGVTPVRVAGVAGVAAGAGALVRADPAASDGLPPKRCRSTASTRRHHHSAQDRLHFVAFDVITRDRARLVELLQSGRPPPPG
jgi:hypothetical protein